MKLVPGKFASVVVLLELAIIIIYAFVVDYEENADVSTHEGKKSNSSIFPTELIEADRFYPMFQDVNVMILVGFGFLMTFAKKYGYSAVGLNMFLAAISVQWAIVMQGIWETVNGKMRINITNLIKGNFASAAVLISFGAVLGKTSPLQLLVMALLEIALFVCNERLGTSVFQAVDVGGSIFVHTFGACFGLAVSRVLFRKEWLSNAKESSCYRSDIFAMIGTLFLWMFWPSFNSALSEGNEKHRIFLNTYLAMLSCCVVTFGVSSLVEKKGKFSMVHIQNATLAGGVAVGATANLLLHPYGALAVGALSAIVSVVGYRFLTPLLLRKFLLHDTCGVNNLHGMPGVFAGLLSAVMASVADDSDYGISLYSLYPARSPAFNSTEYTRLNALLHDNAVTFAGEARTAGIQALSQLYALLSTLVIAITGGVVAGYVLRHPFMEPPKGTQLFDDSDYWELPDDDE